MVHRSVQDSCLCAAVFKKWTLQKYCTRISQSKKHHAKEDKISRRNIWNSKLLRQYTYSLSHRSLCSNTAKNIFNKKSQLSAKNWHFYNFLKIRTTELNSNTSYKRTKSVICFARHYNFSIRAHIFTSFLTFCHQFICKAWKSLVLVSPRTSTHFDSIFTRNSIRIQFPLPPSHP